MGLFSLYDLNRLISFCIPVYTITEIRNNNAVMIKKNYIKDQQIAQLVVHYSECLLYHPFPSMQLK